MAVTHSLCIDNTMLCVQLDQTLLANEGWFIIFTLWLSTKRFWKLESIYNY